MRSVPPALQAKLDSGVTTLARCWVLTRRDGTVLGFTDHDRNLVIDGVTCRADAGLSASEATAQLGLAVGAAEIAGALADGLALEPLPGVLLEALADRLDPLAAATA